MNDTMIQLGVAGAVACFAIVQIVKFAQWMIERKSKQPAPGRRTADARIGEVLDRLKAIETKLDERQASDTKAFAHIDGHITKLDDRIDGLNARLGGVEQTVAAIQARQENRS